MKTFKTAQEFYDFCAKEHACKEGLEEIRNKKLEDWWDVTQRGDWMLWLNECGVWEFTMEQLAEYKRVQAPALAEYERVQASAWAEYKRVKAPAWAEYKDRKSVV